MPNTTESLSDEALTKLIDLVTEASGPDRELDLLIIAALAAPPDAFVKTSPHNGKWCIYLAGPNNDRGSQRLWNDRHWDWGGDRFLITASIDAALALAERLHGDNWYSILVDATREFGAAGVLGPEHLARLIILALLRALQSRQSQ